MTKNILTLHGTKVLGAEVSKYGLEHGYLDYLALAEIVGHRILNNSIIREGYWEQISGDYEDEVYQFYIITEYGATFLTEYTDEIVYYNDELDMYLWGITHFGTSWDYVLTNIMIV